ncbi:MAG TPA: hypothetical protein VFZ65_05850 [Planctomycetota bacterium]|nr:hypothetical protein [Planctomycetota bacterium]
MKSVLVCLFTTASALTTLAAQNDMIGVSFGGASYALSSATGTGALLGSSGLSGLNSMARIGSAIYSVTNGGVLALIDPVTGAGIPLVATSPSLNSVRGLATDPNGVLYAVQDGGSTTIPDILYIIDPSTGNATLIGATAPYSGLQGLAFDAAGTLYAWDVGTGNGIGQGLVVVDPTTGSAFDVNPAVGNAVDVQCLAVSPGGTLYGARSSLYTIDGLTGVATLVGSGGYTDLRGVEFTGFASCTLRNGTGINPVVCSCATLPVLGTNWDIDVTPDATTVLTFAFAAGSPLPFPVPLFGGEALIAPPVVEIPLTGFGMHSVMLPANPMFIGFPLFVQGLRLNLVPAGLTLELTNAQDAVLGM